MQGLCLCFKDWLRHPKRATPACKTADSPTCFQKHTVPFCFILFFLSYRKGFFFKRSLGNVWKGQQKPGRMYNPGTTPRNGEEDTISEVTSLGRSPVTSTGDTAYIYCMAEEHKAVQNVSKMIVCLWSGICRGCIFQCLQTPTGMVTGLCKCQVFSLSSTACMML